ncbi:hypothetical protein Tco_1567100, partial [Tanacetum coccineum]
PLTEGRTVPTSGTVAADSAVSTAIRLMMLVKNVHVYCYVLNVMFYGEYILAYKALGLCG